MANKWLISGLDMGRNVKVVCEFACVVFLFEPYWFDGGSGRVSTIMLFGTSKLFLGEGETALFRDKALCFVSSKEFCEKLS